MQIVTEDRENQLCFLVVVNLQTKVCDMAIEKVMLNCFFVVTEHKEYLNFRGTSTSVMLIHYDCNVN